MTTRLPDRLRAARAGWAPPALRIPVGIIFVAHGAQNLLGTFVLEGTGQFMASLGFAPAARSDAG